MGVDEFLVRLKLTQKVSTASKQKAEGIHSGSDSSPSVIQKTTETVKTSFATSACQYIGYLLDTILRQSGLNSDIVKGLAAFDPFILHKRPFEVALRHFEALYTTFLLRSWVTSADETAYRTEYLELLDYLRGTYPSIFDFTETSPDLIGFLIGLEFLHDRPRLQYLFKLCCLCLTSSSPTLPAVVIRGINTSDFKGRFTDVALPSQSYMVGVPDSVAHCSSDDSLAKFSLLSVDFGQTPSLTTTINGLLSIRLGNLGFISLCHRRTRLPLLLLLPASGLWKRLRRSSSALSKQPALDIPSSLKRKRSGSVGTKSTSSSVKSVSRQGSPR